VLSLVTLRPPQISPLFPYPTLFRSRRDLGGQLDRAQVLQLLLQLVSVLQTANPTGFLDATDGLDLLLRALGGDDGQVARQQVVRSEEHTSELQSRENLVCRLLLEKK